MLKEVITMKLLNYIFIFAVALFLIAGCSAKKEATPEVPVAVEQPVQELTPEEKTTPQTITPDYYEIEITAAKVMVPSELNIKLGTTVRWTNKELRPLNHNVIIMPAGIQSPKEKDIIVKSGNFGPGAYWEYTFDQKGEFVAKDIYSGTASAKITADAVLDPTGIVSSTELGKITVS